MLLTLRSAVAAGLDVSAPAPEVIRAAIHGTADLRRTHNAERRAMQEIVLTLRGPGGGMRFPLEDVDDTYAEQAVILTRGRERGGSR